MWKNRPSPAEMFKDVNFTHHWCGFPGKNSTGRYHSMRSDLKIVPSIQLKGRKNGLTGTDPIGFKLVDGSQKCDDLPNGGNNKAVSNRQYFCFSVPDRGLICLWVHMSCDEHYKFNESQHGKTYGNQTRIITTCPQQ